MSTRDRPDFDLATLVNAILLKHHGELDLDYLIKKLRHRHDINIHSRDLLKILQHYPTRFIIKSKTEKKLTTHIVISKTNVSDIRICTEHAKKQGGCYSNRGECGQLHICKFFLLSGSCHFNEDCIYGHDYQSDHNYSVFLSHFLNPMDIVLEDLRKMFSRIKSRNSSTMPDTCKFYNTSKTCTNNKCRSLHICRHFLEGRCKFEDSCMRNHSIRDPTILEILVDYGFNVGQPRDKILKDLEYLYQNNAVVSSAAAAAADEWDGMFQSYNGLDGGRRLSGQSPRRFSRSDVQCPGLDSRTRSRSPHQRERSPGCSANLRQQTKPHKFHYSTSMDISSSTSLSLFYNSKTSASASPGASSAVKVASLSRSLSNLPKTSFICIHNLHSTCLFGENCRNHHKSTIYQWQWKGQSNNKWRDFDKDNNIELEKDFCEVEKTESYIQMSEEVVKVDFILMRASGHYTDIHCVQRLTTMSSVNSPPNIQKWTTVWHWYWLDDKGKWTEYGKANVLDTTASVITSDRIEEKYLENPNGCIKFKNGDFDYVLLFSKMQQTNSQTGTLRKVQRRPTFFHPSDINKRSSSPSVYKETTNSVILPKDWKLSGVDIFKHYQIVQVLHTTTEFQAINTIFHKTLPLRTITTLERVENGELWNSFYQKKEQMKRKLGKDVQERQLFHGTHRNNVEAICRQGFDFRFCGKSTGTLYGKGSYFAVDASYSDSYTDSGRKMFVAQVLVGDFSKGDPSFVRPPPKNPSEPHGELYDSCVDSVSSPKIFVVFDIYQVYPQYLITYS